MERDQSFLNQNSTNDLTFLEWNMTALFVFCFVARQSTWCPSRYHVSVGSCASSHWQKEECDGRFGEKRRLKRQPGVKVEKQDGGGGEIRAREKVMGVLTRLETFLLLKGSRGKNPGRLCRRTWLQE